MNAGPPKREVAHFTLTAQGLAALLERIEGLPYRTAQPLLVMLEEQGRMIFKDELAQIVNEAPSPVVPILEQSPKGGA